MLLITSMIVGVYINNTTKIAKDAFVGCLFILFASLIVNFVVFYLEKKKRTKGESGVYCVVINVVLYVVGALYLVSIEMVMVFFAGLHPFGVVSHLMLLVILLVLFVIVTVIDYKKMRIAKRR